MTAISQSREAPREGVDFLWPGILNTELLKSRIRLLGAAIPPEVRFEVLI